MIAASVSTPLLRTMMSREVVTVEPENSLREVINVLATNNINGAPVTAGERILGVISKSDIVDFLASTSPVPALRPHQAEWGEVELENEDLPDEESSIFFRGFWQDSSADVVERMDEPDTPEWDILAEYEASSVMTRRLISLPPGATLADAARCMIEQRVHRVLVVEDGTLLGIISATDIVRFVAESMEV